MIEFYLSVTSKIYSFPDMCLYELSSKQFRYTLYLHYNTSWLMMCREVVSVYCDECVDSQQRG